MCVMTGGILASLSRSGVLSLAIAMAVFMLLARTRLGRTRLTLLAAAVGVLLIAAGTYVNLPALLGRMNEAWPSGMGGRLAVWRETWPIVRDFAVTGVGVGAFERAMLVYQESNRLLFFNHAHNEFLQIVAEGGVPLGIGALVVLTIAASSGDVEPARRSIAGILGAGWRGLRAARHRLSVALGHGVAHARQFSALCHSRRGRAPRPGRHSSATCSR